MAKLGEALLFVNFIAQYLWASGIVIGCEFENRCYE